MLTFHFLRQLMMCPMCHYFFPQSLEGGGEIKKGQYSSLSVTLAQNRLIVHALEKAIGVIGPIKEATEKGSGPVGVLLTCQKMKR